MRAGRSAPPLRAAPLDGGPRRRLAAPANSVWALDAVLPDFLLVFDGCVSLALCCARACLGSVIGLVELTSSCL